MRFKLQWVAFILMMAASLGAETKKDHSPKQNWLYFSGSVGPAFSQGRFDSEKGAPEHDLAVVEPMARLMLGAKLFERVILAGHVLLQFDPFQKQLNGPDSEKPKDSFSPEMTSIGVSPGIYLKPDEIFLGLSVGLAKLPAASYQLGWMVGGNLAKEWQMAKTWRFGIAVEYVFAQESFSAQQDRGIYRQQTIGTMIRITQN